MAIEAEVPVRGSRYGSTITVVVPSDWSAAQWVSCQRVCEQQHVQFRPDQWHIPIASEGYIMNTTPINGMFIGIERDGYAHT